MDQIGPTGQVITLIHFTYEVSGQWHIACMPNMLEFHKTLYHPAYERTNDHRAVTCPQCEKTAVYEEAAVMSNVGLGATRRGRS